MTSYTPALNPAGAQPREVSERVNRILSGKINSHGLIALTAASATTTLTNLNIGLDSKIFFAPLSANAKAEGTPWQAITAAGSATLNHANNAQTDRTYAYLVIG